MKSTHLIGGFAALALASGVTLAKLPDPAPLSPDAQAKAAEAKAKADWSNKVAAYQQCMAENSVADKYAKDMKATEAEDAKPNETAPKGGR